METLLVRDGSGANKYILQHKGDGSLMSPYETTTHAKLHGASGYHANVGVFGELLTAQKKVEISVKFGQEINEIYDVTKTLTGDGAVNHVGNLAQITSTTGTAKLFSKDLLIYEAGHTVEVLMTASFNGAGIGSVGLFDANDGIYFTYNNGAISCSYKNGGVATTVTSFNGDSLSGINWTKINVFRISYGYLGVAPITIEVMDTTGLFLMIHKFNTAGALTTTHIGNPTLPIRIETSGAMTVLSGSWSGAVYNGGDLFSGTRPFVFPNLALTSGATHQGQVTLSGTNATTLAVFHNKTTFFGRTNKKKARLLSYNFNVDIGAGNGYGAVLFQIVGNPTLSGTPTYADIETLGSTMEYDHTIGTGASVSYSSGGKVVVNEVVDYLQANRGGSTSEANITAEQIGAVAYPNDSFAILAKDIGGNNVTVRFSFLWEEV